MSDPEFVARVGSTAGSLVAGVRAGDDESWRRLDRIYGPWIMFLLEKRERLPREDAKDVLQEVLTIIHKGIGGFRKERPEDSFRGWIRTIVRTKTVDFVRRREKQPRARGGSAVHAALQAIAVPDDIDEEERDEIARLRLRAIEQLKDKIEPKTWAMFQAVTTGGESPREVAARLGTTAANVRLAKSRVLRRLREMLDGMEPEDFVESGVAGGRS